MNDIRKQDKERQVRNLERDRYNINNLRNTIIFSFVFQTRFFAICRKSFEKKLVGFGWHRCQDSYPLKTDTDSHVPYRPETAIHITSDDMIVGVVLCFSHLFLKLLEFYLLFLHHFLSSPVITKLHLFLLISSFAWIVICINSVSSLGSLSSFLFEHIFPSFFASFCSTLGTGFDVINKSEKSSGMFTRLKDY